MGVQDVQQTTRFLFPARQERTVFEKNTAKEKHRQASLPPLKGGGGCHRRSAPELGPPAANLAYYKHYDVQLDWNEGDVDTSVWAGEVQAYTRMFYARYGAGQPGSTPWRLGRGLKSKAAIQQEGQDTDTFMTRAHIDIQEKLKHTSLDLWQQFSSNPIETVDLDVIRKWAEAMRPRSIHDLKPMLMLCQSLLRDVCKLHTEQLVQTRQEMQESLEQRLQEVNKEAQLREHALQRRVESLKALVAAPYDHAAAAADAEEAKIADMDKLKLAHERQMAAVYAQLEEKEADLAVVAQDLIARGGVPRGRNGAILNPVAPDGIPSFKMHESETLSGSPSDLSVAQDGGKAASGDLASPVSFRTMDPSTSAAIASLAANAPVCGMTPDGRQILQLPDGTRVVVAGYNPDGTPIYADAANPARIVLRIDASGMPVFATRPVIGTDAAGNPIYGEPGPPESPRPLQDGFVATAVAATATGENNAAGQDVFQLADGTRVVIVGRSANGDPIYASADNPQQIVSGLDSSGRPVFSGRPVIGTDASGRPIYGAPGSAPLKPASARGTGQRNASGHEVYELDDGTKVVIVGRSANGDPIYARADDPCQVVAGLDANGCPIFVSSGSSQGNTSRLPSAQLSGTSGHRVSPHGGTSSEHAWQDGRSTPEVQPGELPGLSDAPSLYSLTRSARSSARRSVRTPDADQNVPRAQEVIAEDGSKRYVFAAGVDGEPLEVAAGAVVGKRADGSPIFAAGTVLGFTADGVAIVSDGRGGTVQDASIGKTRVSAAAASAVMQQREQRVREARQAGVLPKAAVFTTGMGVDERAAKAGEYLAAAILHQASLSGLTSATACARAAITAVEAGAAEPTVFAVGELAVGLDGQVVGHVTNNGTTVVSFDGTNVCTLESVSEAADGSLQTEAGAVLSEECVDAASDSITRAAVVHTCQDAQGDTVGYVTPHRSVVTPSGAVMGIFEGSEVMDGAGGTVLANVQEGAAVSVSELTAEAFRATAAAEQEASRVCMPPDFGYAVAPSGAVLGQVLADGTVLSASGECRGLMQPDGTIKTAEGLLVGAAARGMAVVDSDGKLVAVMNEQGFVKTVGKRQLEEGVDMDDGGLLITKAGVEIGTAVGAAPRANAAVRNAKGEVVGFEDARGVVCDAQGQAVARVINGEIKHLPGAMRDAEEVLELDMGCTAVLDAQNNVVGSSQVGATGGTPQRASTASTERQVDIHNEGVTENYGLLRAEDGTVIGSCITTVEEGLAVVSTSGKIIGDVSADGSVADANGAILGTVDKQNVLWSPSGSVMGAVSTLRAVRSFTGALEGALAPSGTVLDTSMEARPTLECRGKEVWSDEGSLVGVVQGRAPPLFTLLPPAAAIPSLNVEGDTEEADRPDGGHDRVRQASRVPATVSWSDLRVFGEDGTPVGWWSTSKGCMVDEGGDELGWPEVDIDMAEPCADLPQALDNDGGFLGYVLTSKAVIDRNGRQVGVVMPDGTVFGESLEPVGVFNLAGMRPNCNVLGANGSPLGFLQQDGRILSPVDGSFAGLLTPSGKVINESGHFIGVVRAPLMDGLTQDADGVVRDADGNAVGRVAADGTVLMGDPFEIREPPEMVCQAIQVALVGLSLADILAGATERPLSPAHNRSSTPGSRASTRSDTSSHLRKLRAATMVMGLSVVAKKHALEVQLERLAELRAAVIEKLSSRQVKDSLLELRKYRRPPRAAAQVITALMVICNEPLCVEWRHQALQGLQFPDHPNHVAQIWVALTPLLMPNLGERLTAVDGADLSQDMKDRIKAASQIMQGMTEKEAQRASLVVRLLHEFINLLQETNAKALELSRIHE